MEKYYKILNLSFGCTQEDVKKAYRVLAKKYHPDIDPSNLEKFKEITHAYNILIGKETLSKAEQRQQTYIKPVKILTKEDKAALERRWAKEERELMEEIRLKQAQRKMSRMKF